MCFKTNTGTPNQTPLSFFPQLHSLHVVTNFVSLVGEGAVAMRAYVPNEQVFNSHSTRNPSPQPNPHTPNPFHHPTNPGWICSLLHKVIKPRLLGKAAMGKIVVGFVLSLTINRFSNTCSESQLVHSWCSLVSQTNAQMKCLLGKQLGIRECITPPMPFVAGTRWTTYM